jgi:C4-dicarboxylate-specific signal transduction histidine kinase
MKQFNGFRAEIIKRFNYQIDLEIANQELKQSKDELIEQTAKLVHISRLAALGEMSAGIAHEINNPLTIMKGGAQLIEKNIMRDDYDRDLILKQSIKIQNSITRITNIIKGLKNFSNLSDNRPKQLVALSDIVEDTFNFCQEPLVNNNIKLIIEPVPECRLFCHPVQISQVLINLIKNAQDYLTEYYTDEKGWIKLDFSISPENLQINVSNSGAKIKEDVAEKLFQPFFSTKPVGAGTGLGLSISQKIMKEHEGNLILDNSNEHTTFVVTHPIQNLE